jgi:hypothetical protein
VAQVKRCTWRERNEVHVVLFQIAHRLWQQCDARRELEVGLARDIQAAKSL